MMWPASSLKKPANKSSAGVKLGESLVDIGLLGERVHNLLVKSGLPIEHVDGGLKVARERLLAVRDLFDELDRFYEHLLLDPNGFGKFSHTFLVRPVVSLARTGVRLTGMSIDIRRCRINGFLLGLGRRFSNLSVLLADVIEKVLEFLKKRIFVPFSASSPRFVSIWLIDSWSNIVGSIFISFFPSLGWLLGWRFPI